MYVQGRIGRPLLAPEARGGSLACLDPMRGMSISTEPVDPLGFCPPIAEDQSARVSRSRMEGKQTTQ